MYEKKKRIIDIDLYLKAQKDYKNHSVRRLKEELHISTDQASYLKKCWNDPEFQKQEDKKKLKELKKVSGWNYEELDQLKFYCFKTTRELRKRKKMQKIALERMKINPKFANGFADKPYFYDLNNKDFTCKKQ
jgi:hypothetical protein